ncbi:MAG: NADH-quinone oxidoreductase subunit M [Actinomycetota bacterium]|nr:NADH-quinone oxidoreductase subunit M [Actinomycetota bacterium]
MAKWLPTALTFIPLLFTFIIMFTPKEKELAIKLTALVGTGLVLLGAIYMVAAYDYARGGFQMAVKLPWITAIGAQYNMAVDGISVPIVFLTALLTFICIIASWKINYRIKEYMGFMLFLEVGSIGVFLALDFILFYVFWEIVLIPMYFLIGIWGGPRKEYAAIKFFLYTFVGSVFMLLGILALYFYSGINTFDMMALAKAHIPTLVIKLAFLGMFLGFAVKVPIVPFHTWLPDAHVEAPTAVSVLLAGVLLKMGSYAFIRIGLGVVPTGMKAFVWLIALLGVISIIYGALCAMVQKDLKKLVAYSSVSHMGYIMLGIASMTAIGVSGAVLQMFSHGVITGMLFLVVGVIYERSHTREIEKLGGILVSMSLIGGIWVYISLASFGLPSLAGFVGEFLIIIGAFKFSHILAGIAALGIILTAGYLLWTIQRICLGEPKTDEPWADASPRELAYMMPLLALIVVIGFFPGLVLRVIEPTTGALMATVAKTGGM